MTNYDVKRLALILAVQAEIEGAKSRNIYEGFSFYEENYFEEKAMELRNLAHAHDDQL